MQIYSDQFDIGDFFILRKYQGKGVDKTIAKSLICFQVSGEFIYHELTTENEHFLGS